MKYARRGNAAHKSKGKTMAYVIGNQNRKLGLRERLTEIFEGLREARRYRAAYRETLVELQAMSDRDLPISASVRRRSVALRTVPRRTRSRSGAGSEDLSVKEISARLLLP